MMSRTEEPAARKGQGRTVLFASAAAILAALSSNAWADCANPRQWQEHVNDRFGMRIEVPVDCFYAQPPAENDDGRLFRAGDQVELGVYGAHNAMEQDPKSLRQWLLREIDGYDDLTYSPSGSNWLVMSGYRGDKIYYEKYIFSHGGAILNSFWITFPADDKPVFSPIIERMEDSFRPGDGYQTP